MLSRRAALTHCARAEPAPAEPALAVEAGPVDLRHDDAGHVSARSLCAQGGTDTCQRPPVLSMLATEPNYRIGALRQALGPPKQEQ